MVLLYKWVGKKKRFCYASGIGEKNGLAKQVVWGKKWFAYTSGLGEKIVWLYKGFGVKNGLAIHTKHVFKNVKL